VKRRNSKIVFNKGFLKLSVIVETLERSVEIIDQILMIFKMDFLVHNLRFVHISKFRKERAWMHAGIILFLVFCITFYDIS